MKRLRAALAFIVARRLALPLLAALAVVPVFFSPRVMLPGGTFSWLFVIDITESMNVRDADPAFPNESRLDRAKSAVIAALASLPCGSRASVALFAGTDAVTLFEPLETCRHFPAIEKVVRNIDWRMAWDGDSRIEEGLVNALHEAGRRHLDVVFISDGDEAPHVDAPRMSDLLALRGPVKGWLLGVGSAEPQPVPRLDDENRIVGYWSALDAAREGFHPNLVETLARGASGAEVDKAIQSEGIVEHRSALRASYLEQIGAAAGLGYATADSPGKLVALATNAAMERHEIAERDIRLVFGMLSAMLLALDWLLTRVRLSSSIGIRSAPRFFWRAAQPAATRM